MLQETVPVKPIDLPETIRMVATAVTLVISLTNLVLTVILFQFKNKKEDAESERKLKLDWFNKLILDYNLPYFHNFFENSSKQLEVLKTPSLSDEEKGKVLDAIKDNQKEFRIHFADSLLAVDQSLYNKIIEISDGLIDEITNTIFNAGILLSHPPKFEEEITVKITSCKTEMVKQLFRYDGVTFTKDNSLTKISNKIKVNFFSKS